MIRLPAVLVAPLGVILAAINSAHAGEFQITVTIDLVDRQVRNEETLETPTTKKPPPRPVAELTHDQAARVSWRVENTSTSEEFRDVLVHFFVVREEKIGQDKVPKLTNDVAYEGALTTDFKPREKADWNWTLNIHEPGNYLLRVETIGMLKKHGHEHYAALDLIVK